MNMIHTPRKARGILSVRADAGANPDIKALIGELNAKFAAFQEANDTRLSEIESRTADVVTAEKVDRINADITKTQEALDKALQEFSAGQLGGGADAVEQQETLARNANAFFAGMRGVESDRITDADIEGYKAYATAYPQFLRRGAGASMPADVLAAMQVGSDPDGGYWVPTQKSNMIIERLYETSPVRQVADVISITTDSIEWPNDTNDATTGGWVGETEARPETATPQVGTQTIYVREQYAMPIATQKLLDMSTVDVEAWLFRKIADKLSRVENTAFVSGTGVNSPKGMLTYKDAAVTTDDASRDWGKLQYVPSGAAGGFPNVSGSTVASDPDALITLIAKLKPEYRGNARFMMSRATEAAIRKMKDADGNYLIAPLTGGATGFDLFGFPIATAEDFPALASDSFSLAFGDFREGYQIVDGRGIRVLRDNLTTKGKVKFYTTKWTGGDVKNFDAIKLMKFATS